MSTESVPSPVLMVTEWIVPVKNCHCSPLSVTDRPFPRESSVMESFAEVPSIVRSYWPVKVAKPVPGSIFHRPVSESV
jgi:hypothetical protein